MTSDMAALEIAPDGSRVRVLERTQRVSVAEFLFDAGSVSRAVSHLSVEETWRVVAGRGRLWRRNNGLEDIIELRPGTTLVLCVGSTFQFQADSALTIFAVTVPPWPLDREEAVPALGPWAPTV
ncbi:MAG: mannose-6-phosphate isomerase-like protein (cupin superfamily) [Gammaproteobacteria bacterium]|jgi:mannose-6-phosphate isomerase-like protein (cupin superfamily)